MVGAAVKPNERIIRGRRVTGKNVITGKPRRYGINKKFVYRLYFPSYFVDNGRLEGELEPECAADSSEQAKSIILISKGLGHILKKIETGDGVVRNPSYYDITVEDITEETRVLLSLYFIHKQVDKPRQLQLRDNESYGREYRKLCIIEKYVKTHTDHNGVVDYESTDLLKNPVVIDDLTDGDIKLGDLIHGMQLNFEDHEAYAEKCDAYDTEYNKHIEESGEQLLGIKLSTKHRLFNKWNNK